MPARHAAAQPQAPDSKGTDFILAVPRNFPTSNEHVTLFVAADASTVVEISGPGVTTQTITVTGGTTRAVDLPLSVRVETPNVVVNGGIRVRSLDAAKEIAVYILNQAAATTDAYVGLPVDVLGTSYRVAAWEALFADAPSQVLLAATEDNTLVTVTPTVNAPGFTAGLARNIVLNRLQVFELEAPAGDLTGTLVTSDKPIAVFGGTRCANVPVGVGACDHLVEQIPPAVTFASEFVVAPIAPRTGGDIVRVVAHEAGTQVSINGTPAATLDAGQFFTYSQPSTSGTHIETSKPALVMQYNKGSGADGVTTDPFMMTVVPVNQFASKYVFSTPPAAPVAFTNFVNVTIRGTDKAGLQLDGVPVSATWKPIAGTPFEYARLPIAIGTHRLEHVSPIVPFGIGVYGHAFFDSYGYAGGLRLAPLQAECTVTEPEAGDGLDNDCDGTVDEELNNDVDDDGDGAADEDLAEPPPNSPPSANAGEDQVVEAQNASGAPVVLDGSASADPDEDELTYTWNGPFGTLSGVSASVTLSLGTHTITLTVTDPSGESASDTMTVTVQDTTAPSLVAPADRTVEATGAAGAVASFAATATDSVDPEVDVICDPASGSQFPLGATVVHCTATDAAGNTAEGSFAITVRDTTAPVLTMPANQTLEATGPAGATAAFTATATDLVTPDPTITCSAASGSTFPLSATTVSCTATDAAGNRADGSFTITVRDTTAPSLTLPANLLLEATGPAGASTTFAATATDIVDAAVAISCSASSGATFALGTTSVTCTAIDDAGNSAQGSFTITVRDTTAPVLTMPASLVLEATSGSGAVATFAATATDIADADVAITCNATSGSVFPLGVTIVSCTATDDARNASSGTFSVTVRDTTAPALGTITPSEAFLWSPNHVLADVSLAYAVNDAVSAPSCAASVSSDEAVDSDGDGSTDVDWVVESATLVRLRAERDGSGDGRVYTITVTCTDQAGNGSSSTTAVYVPKSQSK